ncbi:hypothetical protein [Calothrix sp. 336/3]|uniref:hypothetical protein n=1 Tax=Calothrix sp. 336/3 TaxID=1337936 RepID=UPI000624687A|nr:hypothetical protein [Calothrix sp. 336/3]AKG21794.1 hypothetical protein IJ00_11475 [Calothrix sp. 336/3]
MKLRIFSHRHFTDFVFGVVILVLLFAARDDISRSIQLLNEDKTRISASSQETRKLEQSQEIAKAKAAIASQRYKDGCLLVVAANSPTNLATLVPGEAVIDRITKRPLPSGTVVCDGNGNTAILVPNLDRKPVIGEIAYTGNRDLVMKTVKRINGARLYYNTPEK